MTDNPRKGLTDEQQRALRGMTRTVLDGRAHSIQGYRLTGNASDRLKVNPYLLPIVASLAPSIAAGTGRHAAAQYLVTARFVAGIETSTGKLFDEQFTAILGGRPVPGKDEYLDIKRRLSRRQRNAPTGVERRKLEARATELVWLAEFDSWLVRDGIDYYISLKSGPWTLNDTMAREMASAFAHAAAQGIVPVLGIIYGSEEDLSNKPGIVLAGAGNKGLLKIGGDLIRFITGSAEAAADVLNAITDGCRDFQREVGTLSPFLEAVNAVESELEDLYGIPPDADIYSIAATIALGRPRR